MDEAVAVSVGGGVEPAMVSHDVATHPVTASVVLQYWKGIGLEARRPELDQEMVHISRSKEESLASRKRVAEQTREFKKAPEDGKLQLVGNLVKTYQTEIDNLTRRAKFAENAWLALYQVLSEAPDPVPCLDTAVAHEDALLDMDHEMRKLKNELEELRTNRSEAVEERASVLLDSRQRVMEENHKRAMEECHAREQFLIQQVEMLKMALANALKSHEITQGHLFEARNRIEEEQITHQQELSILSDDVERSHSRAVTLQREKDELQSALEDKARPPSQPVVPEELVARFEMELTEKERALEDLRTRTLEVEAAATEERKEASATLRDMECTLEELRKELRSRPTSEEHEAMKRELRVLQAVEYKVVDGEEDIENGEDRTTERLLMGKIRRLEDEVTRAKVTAHESSREVAHMKVKLLHAEELVADQKRLIKKLEDDIAKHYSLSQGDRWDAERLEDLLSQPGQQQGTSSSSSDQQSLLQIVCGQRDRFRQRLLEFEAENRRLHQQAAAHAQDVEGLRTDNVKLYEKIRYLESYAGADPANRGPSSSPNIGWERSGKSSDRVESRYKKLYEETMNPFTAFNRRERHDRYNDLNPAEKITFIGSKFFLSNRYARMFLFFYLCFLHILVFLTVYHFASEHERCPVVSQ